MKNLDTLKFILRFSVLFLLVNSVFAFLFVALQNTLPEANRVALDLYEPYRKFGIIPIIGQLIRGIVFALVVFPFYSIIFNRKNGKLILFSTLFGVALVGSVEPQPGSIEGIIYTLISLPEHLLILASIALQMLVFVWIIFKTERYFIKEMNIENTLPASFKATKSYISRFVIVHLITYWVVGSIFYQIAGYADALESMEIFKLWRPLENLPAVLLVFFGQIFRGIFLAILLFPFYEAYIQKKHGYWLLFLLMFGLTARSPIFITEFIAFEGTLLDFMKELIVGIPEIVSQMLVFSILFFWWQKNAYKKKQLKNE